MALPFHSQIQSSVPTGTAPLSIVSTTLVDNLNADLLDGQHGSFYQNAGNLNAGTIPTGRLSGTYPISISGSADIVSVADTRAVTTTPQTINRSVVFDFKENASNGLNDGGNYFGLMTFRQYGANTDWSGGLSHQLGFTDNGNIWQRSGSNTTWGSWKKLWDDANDGAGSGLDADLLDGQHGSYYAAASSLGNYLPLTGGTLTGGLTGTTASFTGDFQSGGAIIRASASTAGHAWLSTAAYGVSQGDGRTHFGYNTGTQYENYIRGAHTVVNGSFQVVGSVTAQSALAVTGAITQNGNQVLHASNYSSYALPLSGGTLTGELAISTGTSTGLRVNAPSGTQSFWLRVGYDTDGTATPVASALNTMLQSSGSSAGTFTIVCGNTKTATLSNTAANFAVALQQGGNQVLHAGNYTSYLNNTYLRAAGHPGYDDWNVFGNTAQTVNSIFQENFNIPTSTGSSNFPTNAAYKYGTLVNFGSGSDARAQVYISHAGNDLVFRGGWGTASWQTWNRCLTDQNYNSYSPTLSGTGATGTWGISITGTSRGVGTSDPTIGTGGLWVTTATGLNVARNGTAYVVLDAGNYSSYSPPLAQAVYGENATATTNLSENNLDSALKSGFYTVNKVDNSKLPATSTAVNFLIHCSYVGVGNTAGIDLLTQDSTTSNLFYRNATGAGKGAWRTVLDSANYNSYAPTLTGTGASGTWGINISGSAAQLNGQAASFYQNAGNLNAGTLPSARLSGTYTIDIAGASSSGSRLGLWDATAYITGSNTISGAGGRGVNLAPNTYVKQISFEFKNTSFASMGGNYGGLITIAPWDGTAVSTGDPNYQLLFSASAANSTSNPVLRLRAGIDAGWGAWATLIHDANFATAIPNSGVTAGTYNNVTVNAKGIVTGGSNVSYLTGNQSITLSGDVSGSGATAIAVTIGAGAVTYAKIQNVAISSVLGNSSASVAQAPQALSMATLAGMLSGQTMNIAGSSTSCTGNAATATTATNSTQLNGQAASYYENRDTTAVSISAGTLTLTRAAGNLTATIGGRVVAWCEFNGNFASSQSPNAAFNVSSITKNATGDYTVNFTSALANANYVVSGTAQLDAPSPGQSVNNVFVAVPRRSGAKATGSCRIVCEYPSGLSLWDCGSVGVAFIAA